MALRVTPLGAAQQVGRSCILLEIGGRNVLLDCGVAAHSSGSYYPEFSLLGEVQSLDVVIITHFHLDHVGALPYLTEILGYHGPILMTHPTRAIGPIIIKDALAFRRDAEALTPEMVDAPFDRARCFQLQERVEIGDLSVTSFYAGHVLGAVMVHLECRGQSALYTGDFTMVSDYHLSAARVPLALHPDVMITETTCCTTIRSSKRREVNDLCSRVQDCLEKGGKVLVPLLVMGRSTEICMILEEHWAKAKLAYPIFVISAMAQKAEESTQRGHLLLTAGRRSAILAGLHCSRIVQAPLPRGTVRGVSRAGNLRRKCGGCGCQGSGSNTRHRAVPKGAEAVAAYHVNGHFKLC